jgi:hypothetical protein
LRAAGWTGVGGVVAFGLGFLSLQGRGEGHTANVAEVAPATALPTAASAPAPVATVAEPVPVVEPTVPPTTTSPPRSDATVGSRQPGSQPQGSGRRRGRRGFSNDFESLPVFAEWVPPEGPVRIGLQAGHWKSAEVPDYLSDLRSNGTNGGGKAEWEVNLEIARRTAALLEAKGYLVDILPTTVPPAYRAHLFIAIHSDGALDPAATGYRVAAPRRDPTQKAAGFVDLLERTYADATGLKKLPTVTRRMQAYYAFNSRRYQHALHPMTIGVIIETGFLTSASDRRLIVNDPDRVAKGIADAVAQFPLTPPPNGAAPR